MRMFYLIPEHITVLKYLHLHAMFSCFSLTVPEIDVSEWTSTEVKPEAVESDYHHSVGVEQLTSAAECHEDPTSNGDIIHSVDSNG